MIVAAVATVVVDELDIRCRRGKVASGRPFADVYLEEAPIIALGAKTVLERHVFAVLGVLRSAGIFNLVKNSRLRQQRLLILCYHGTSLEDKHLWQPNLYMHPQELEERFECLKKGSFSLLPLGEALQRLRAGTLPPRSGALTFDDGPYDFFRQAYPLLKADGFPVTVYQTSYYISVEWPVFHLICSYMLWK